MGIFDIRKPRRFHHEYIYYNQRKERLKAVEERAKASPGMQDASKSAPTDLHEGCMAYSSVPQDTHAGEGNESWPGDWF